MAHKYAKPRTEYTALSSSEKSWSLKRRSIERGSEKADRYSLAIYHGGIVYVCMAEFTLGMCDCSLESI